MFFVGSGSLAQERDEDGQPSTPPAPGKSITAGERPSPDRGTTPGRPTGVQYGEQAKGAPDLYPGRGGDRGSGGPDTYGYSWVDSDATYGPSYSWVEINTTGTELVLSDDAYSGALGLGFTFNFYGTGFTDVYVSSNGWLTFDTPTTSASYNYSITNTSAPNNLVAPFWDNLDSDSGNAGKIYYYADATNNRFIVEFDAVQHYPSGNPETFQAILNANGSIVYQYKTVAYERSCTVGIENGAGDDGLEVVYNTTYLHDSLAILVAKRFQGKDTYGYYGADSNHESGPAYNWVEINSSGTALTLGDDANSGALSLGFTFNHYGTNFTTVNVCSNGWLSFDSTSNSLSNYGIPYSVVPNNLLALLWDNLQPVGGGGGGTVYYYADTANDRFIVEFDGVEDYSTAIPQTFQVILRDDDSILYQYKDVGNPLHECTVGIENGAGSVGLEAAYNEYYLHNNLAIRFTPPGRLTTNFATNNGSRGNTFDIVTKWSIEKITGIDINTGSTSTVSVDVYYKSGTCVGYENTSGAWTLLASGSATGQGFDNPTYIDLPDASGVSFGGGLTYGFYVDVSTERGIAYTNGGPTTYENADLKLITNSGQGGLFSSYYYPREWSGTLHYTLSPDLVELVFFKAMGCGQVVQISWETASEIDTAGFHIWRSGKRNPGENDYVRVTGQLIAAQGSPSYGASYYYNDLAVVPGHPYCYRLEDISYSGESTFHDPVVVRWWKPSDEHR